VTEPHPEESATARLAAFAADLRFADLPAAVVAQAKRCILDALGCCLYGVTVPWTRMLIDFVAEEGGRPRAGIIGTRVRTSVSQAVLVGATAGHGFELDDIHTAAHLHAGSLAIPVAVAMAQTQAGCSGRDLITAIVAGYEVGLRVGLAATGGLFMRGHHFQGTCGVFVAAATAARMIGLPAGQARHALGIAGSQAAGLMAAQEGGMVKRLHAGKAAQAGVYGAYLAARGFTGIENVLEATYGGFLSTLSPEPDRARLTAGLGVDWEMLKVGFKPYATAASIQSPLSALEGLMREHALDASDIDDILVHCSSQAHRHCAWPYRPAGVTAAQMNMPFALAMMAVDGAAMGDQFREDRLADPRVLAVIARIRVVADPRYDRGADATRHAARIAVRTRAGAVLEREVLDRPGSPANPMSAAQREAKFVGLADKVLSADATRAVIDRVAGLDALAASDLIQLLHPGTETVAARDSTETARVASA
jgi:2-methylcitrate dehydratase PrpD